MPVRVKKGVTWEESKKRIVEVIEDIKLGSTAEEAALKHGLSKLTVIRICQQNKVSRPECSARKNKVHERRASAVEEVKNGGVLEDIASKYGYRIGSLAHLCSNSGVSVAGKSKTKIKYRRPRMEFEEMMEWAYSQCCKNSETECLIWPGEVNNKGYPMIHFKGKNVSLHRLSFEYHHGYKLVGDLCALHRCDTPRCIFGPHLFPGTRAENNIDKMIKGRAGSLKGENHKSAKISEKEAIEIIDLIKCNIYQLKDIASMYGLSPEAVSGIKSGRKWSYLPR